jgi:AmmeMemoRadiSam system protein A
MVPMPFSEVDQRILLKVALQSLQEGLRAQRALTVDVQDYSAALREPLACFVTLNKQGSLRGCIGHLQAMQPLVRDVADNAYAAGFLDPRFAPISAAELAQLDIHISVLSSPEPLDFSSEADVLAKIRPGVDGLILRDGQYQGTFLPSVWEQLPDPRQFWLHLKRKAGLPVDHWSDRLKLFRYTSVAFGAAVAEIHQGD